MDADDGTQRSEPTAATVEDGGRPSQRLRRGEIPTEVLAEIRRGRELWLRRFGRSIFLALCGYLVFLPGLVVVSGSPLFLFSAMMVMMVGVSFFTVRGHFLPMHGYTVFAAIQVALLTYLYSPALSMGVAVVIAMQLALNPALRRRDVVTITAVIYAALVVPVLAGELGWIDRLFTVTPSGIEFKLVGATTQASLFAFCCVGMAVLIVVSIVLASRIRIASVAATSQLQLQSWHLRQLLPSE